MFTQKKGKKNLEPFFPFYTPPPYLHTASLTCMMFTNTVPLVHDNGILPAHAFRAGFTSPLHDAIISKWQPFVGWQMSCRCFHSPASHRLTLTLSLFPFLHPRVWRSRWMRYQWAHTPASHRFSVTERQASIERICTSGTWGHKANIIKRACVNTCMLMCTHFAQF